MEYEYNHEAIKGRRIDRAIEISADLFLKNGIANVKMTDIAEESGIGVATLYRYFGTKTSITIAAMTYLWNQINDMFSEVFESEIFLSQRGIKQINDLMRMFIVLYNAHPDFMKLLEEFDLFLAKEKVPKDELKGYDKSIINFYPIFEKAYNAGVADGTIREVKNIRLFYLSYAHALLEMCKKLTQGELLPSDNFAFAESELETLIETVIYYLKK